MNRKYTFAIAVIAGLLISGCSEETKEHAKAAAQSAAKDTAAAIQTAKEKSADALSQAQAKASEAMDQAKQAAAEAVEKAKESAAKMEEAAKAKTAEAVETAKKSAATMGEAAKAKTAEAAAVVEEKAAEVKKTMANETAAPAADGAALFAKCAGCHGADGKMKALGKSPVIAGEPADSIAQKLKAYKEGKRNAYGMGGVMQGQAAGLSDSDIATLAEYISTLK